MIYTLNIIHLIYASRYKQRQEARQDTLRLAENTSTGLTSVLVGTNAYRWAVGWRRSDFLRSTALSLSFRRLGWQKFGVDEGHNTALADDNVSEKLV